MGNLVLLIRVFLSYKNGTAESENQGKWVAELDSFAQQRVVCGVDIKGLIETVMF